MDEVLYVHIRWPDGQDDMVPASTAEVRAGCGDFEIVDSTPGRYRQFKPRLPLGTAASPKRTKTEKVTEPAPEGPTPEEAQA